MDEKRDTGGGVAEQWQVGDWLFVIEGDPLEDPDDIEYFIDQVLKLRAGGELYSIHQIYPHKEGHRSVSLDYKGSKVRKMLPEEIVRFKLLGEVPDA